MNGHWAPWVLNSLLGLSPGSFSADMTSACLQMSWILFIQGSVGFASGLDVASGGFGRIGSTGFKHHVGTGFCLGFVTVNRSSCENEMRVHIMVANNKHPGSCASCDAGSGLG